MGTALITGATAGIGYELAAQLAGHQHDLVLVARNAERLTEVGQRLAHQFQVSVETMSADLAERDQVDAVASRLADRDQPVDWLVNNAGFGNKADFDRTDVADEQRLLDVLITAPMRLTHAAMPGMLERGYGRILNVSSVASFIPGGAYSAAKSWVTVFSESLNSQYRGQGVHVCALCPGYTHTEFHQRAEIDMSTLPEIMWTNAAEVAYAGLIGCELGRPIVVPGLVYKGVSLLTSVLPRPLVRTIIHKSW